MISMSSLLQKLPFNAEPGKIVSPMMHMKYAFRNETQEPSESDDGLRRRAEKVLGVDLQGIDMHQFSMGMNVEREHDDVTNGDWRLIAKIALAHLRELPDYYTKLAQMERPQIRDAALPIIKKNLGLGFSSKSNIPTS